MKSTYQKMTDAMESDGDPDDINLNIIEEEYIWPRIVDNKIKNVICEADKKVLEDCLNKFGLLLSPLCFLKKAYYGACVLRSRSSEDTRDDCLDEYLALRSEYRRTKDPIYLNRMKGMVFPSQYGPDSKYET